MKKPKLCVKCACYQEFSGACMHGATLEIDLVDGSSSWAGRKPASKCRANDNSGCGSTGRYWQALPWYHDISEWVMPAVIIVAVFVAGMSIFWSAVANQAHVAK